MVPATSCIVAACFKLYLVREHATVSLQEREFDGVNYIMEKAITGDYSLIKGWKADKHGNVVFRYKAALYNTQVIRLVCFYCL